LAASLKKALQNYNENNFMRHLNAYAKYIEATTYYFSLGFWYTRHGVLFRFYIFQKKKKIKLF